MMATSNVRPDARDKAIAGWLLICCALVAAIIIIGGATRLTGSGLSIVVWEPIMGIIPPLSEQAWLEAFDQYRQFPEYQEINRGMTLAEFQFIFWWEYWHRVVGRLIGLVFFVGFAYFLLTRQLDRPLTWKLAGLLALGGLQGGMGWYMVTSGLVDVPHVSHYRLTAHLGLALLIYGLMLWLALSLLRPTAATGTDAHAGLRRAGWWLLGLLTITIVYGAFVAGTRAGFFYNTFPLMNGQWIPDGLWMLEPWAANWTNNQITIQFVHRWLAISTFLAVLGYWFVARGRLSGGASWALHALLAAAVLQVLLGVFTLLLQVPITLGVAHQSGAVVLLTALLVLQRFLLSDTVAEPVSAVAPSESAALAR